MNLKRSNIKIGSCTVIASLIGFLSMTPAYSAVPLGMAKVCDLSGNVILKKEGSEANRNATLEDQITGKDVIATGAKSRAELNFPDDSFSRLGSNTVFSFDPQTRNLMISKGLAFVHIPPGRGGLRVVTLAATAAIQGDTIIARVLPDGDVYFTGLSPEDENGKIIITLQQSGVTFPLEPGHTVVIPQNASDLSQVSNVEIDVQRFIQKSPLLEKELPKTAKAEMSAVMKEQAEAFRSGHAQRTDIAIVGNRVVKADSDGNFNRGSLKNEQGDIAKNDKHHLMGDALITVPAKASPSKQASIAETLNSAHSIANANTRTSIAEISKHHKK